MKRHFNELKAMVHSINAETNGDMLFIERSEPIHGEVGFSYKYRIGRNEILLNWSGFGEAYGFLKALILSLDIQGDILISREDSQDTIDWAVKNSTKNLEARIKAMEHKMCILHSDVACRDDRIKELEMQNDACSMHLRNLHDLRAELAIKDMSVKNLQRKINTLEIELSNCNAAVVIPTRATIVAELKLAWNTNGQTHLFHTWCRMLLKEIIIGKLIPPAEDNKLFMEYAVAGVSGDKAFISMIGEKYVAAIQSHLLRVEEERIAPKLMKI